VAPTVDDAALAALLAPLREHVADLNLSRTPITDASLAFISGLPNLYRLNISSTTVTEQGLGSLAEHPKLGELVISQTRMTDAAFEPLLALPALERVYVWKSGLTPETIAELRAELPGVTIDAGDTPDAVALEVETEIKLTSTSSAAAAPPAASPAAPPTADALKPVNSTCPVAGTPIEPGFAIVHKGRVIGFCCRHCVGKFLEDPEKYEDKIH
jgi:hypothetical protein